MQAMLCIFGRIQCIFLNKPTYKILDQSMGLVKIYKRVFKICWHQQQWEKIQSFDKANVI